MSDWLSQDDSDGGYLGLDDPAAPGQPGAPPTDPSLAGGNDGWLQAGHQVDSGVADTQGAWINPEPAAQAPAGDPAMDWSGAASQPAIDPYAANDPYAAQAQQYGAMPAATAPPAAHMAASGGHAGDISVVAPMLENVAASPRSIGGARGELSDLVLDVEVEVEVALGNSALTVEEFLEMGRGSIVELDKPVDAPIELRVRGKLVARGQLVSINGAFGMRIIDMIGEEN